MIIFVVKSKCWRRGTFPVLQSTNVDISCSIQTIIDKRFAVQHPKTRVDPDVSSDKQSAMEVLAEHPQTRIDPDVWLPQSQTETT